MKKGNPHSEGAVWSAFNCRDDTISGKHERVVHYYCWWCAPRWGCTTAAACTKMHQSCHQIDMVTRRVVELNTKLLGGTELRLPQKFFESHGSWSYLLGQKKLCLSIWIRRHIGWQNSLVCCNRRSHQRGATTIKSKLLHTNIQSIHIWGEVPEKCQNSVSFTILTFSAFCYY